jgi:3-dehydroquinate synthase
LPELVFHSQLGPSRVWLGRGGLETLCRAALDLPAPRLLLSETRVARALQRQQEELLERVEPQRLILPAGEGAKNSANLLTVLAEMAALGMERGSPLIAWGGGMIGDLGGLAASLWKRGAPLVLVPTTLLAQVDACVGGKTAINFAGLRNAVGSFWPARRVVADLDALASLPREEWLSGFGELLKAAWLSDEAWARELEAGGEELLRADHPALERHVERALRFKIAVAEADEREAGPRALLNLGHTFAHALEAVRGEGLRHGQAVLYGMLAAARAARMAGVAAPAEADEMEGRLRGLLRRLGLLPAPELAALPRAALLKAMAQDKKARDGRLRLVLPERPGRARVEEVDATLAACVWEEWGRLLR